MKNEERSKVRPYRPIVKLIIWLLLFLVSLLSVAMVFGAYSDEIDNWLVQKRNQYTEWRLERKMKKNIEKGQPIGEVHIEIISGAIPNSN